MLRANKPRHVPWVTVNDLEFDDLSDDAPKESDGEPWQEPIYEFRYAVQNTLGERGPSFISALDEKDARSKGQQLGYGGLFSGGMIVTFLGRFRCPGES